MLPKGWQVRKLGEVIFHCSSGATPYRGRPEFYKGLIKWITSGELNYNVIEDTIEHISQEAVEKTNLKMHPSGTFLMAITGLEAAGTRGACGIVGNPATTNQSCMAVYPTDELKTEYLYHYYVYRGNEMALRYCQGTKQQSYTAKLVRLLPILLPSDIAEQEAIAEALSDADALIESLDKLIAKKRNIKQGAMQELLRPKKGWIPKKLGSFGVFMKGCGIKKDESQSGNNPCIRYGEIYTKHNDYIRAFHSWISEEVAASAKALKTGDILFAGSGETKEEIGKCVAYINYVEAYAGGDIVILRPNNVSSLFLGYYLNTPSINRQKASKGQGDAVVHISSNALADIDLILPSTKAEQESIGTILLDMDTEISLLEAKLTKARQIKQGMMQELLTGRIRLDTVASNKSASDSANSHNWQINEAVILSVLAKNFGSQKYPLGRMRYTKLAYLFHRHVERCVKGYLKKAAGPYNPAIKYKGPEAIATKNGYILLHSKGKFEGFIAADNVAVAEAYFEKWYDPEVLVWLEQFRYKKNDELELLATVDMAMNDLIHAGKPVELGTVKKIINDHPEWEAKLQREIFSDLNITRAIKTCRELFT